MIYAVPVNFVCDGCGRVQMGAREFSVVPEGEAARFVLPSRWVSAVVRPQILAPHVGPIEAFQPAGELARLTGQPIQAAYCGACAAKATSKRVVGESLAEASAWPGPVQAADEVKGGEHG